MLKRLLFGFIVLLAAKSSAQLSATEFEAQVIGGKDQLEQTLETQLTLPKALLTSNFDVHVTAFFDLDSLSSPVNVTFKSGLNNALRNETIRFLHFLKFKKTQNEAYETSPYYLSYHISTERYNKFLKQRSKLNLKKNQAADSSFIIYSKAERAPEYYKNGDEGLAEFILSEIEYPKLAVEKSVEGTVVVEFVVETNGYATGIAVKQGLGAGCTEEALRLIKSTKWQPAVLNNKLVRYKMTYPITFSLRNVTRDASSTIGQ
jgi:TonB family protein